MPPFPTVDSALDSTSSKLLLTGQTHALQLAVSGSPLEEVLEVLVQAAESQSDGSFLGSILLLDEDGKHLRHGAAPSLPAAYNAAIDGVAIGPKVGSCGTAAHFGHAIVVTDIASDPLWADFRDLALEHGLKACWSTPFHAKDGTVLGTLALYYREPRGPSEKDRAVVRLIGNTAAVVVANARLYTRLKDLNERNRLAADACGLGFFTWDIGSDTVTWHNEQPYAIFGIPATQGPINAGTFVSDFLHPDDRDAFTQAVDAALERGTSFHFEGRIRRQPDGEIRWLEVSGKLDAGAQARGKPRLVGVASDVTARRQAAQPG